MLLLLDSPHPHPRPVTMSLALIAAELCAPVTTLHIWSPSFATAT
jgi:hypothetical protein